jgi:hypothetical protein
MLQREGDTGIVAGSFRDIHTSVDPRVAQGELVAFTSVTWVQLGLPRGLNHKAPQITGLWSQPGSNR